MTRRARVAAKPRFPRGERRLAGWRTGLLLCAGLGLAAAGPVRALPPDAAGLAARRATNETASEHWDLMARFTSGHGLFLRAMLTNAGPGSNTAVVTGQVVFPDGRIHPFSNGRREERWSASPDGLFLKVGGSELDLRGEQRRFSKQSKKQRIQLEMHFAARPTVLSSDAGEPGIAANSIAPIEGSFQVGDMSERLSVEGVVFLRHAWSRGSEAELTRRWIDVLAGDARDGVVLWGLETPGGERRQWLSVLRGGEPQIETSAFRFEPTGSAGPEANYPVPQRIALRGDGIDGVLELGAEQVRADPMKMIPQPFRWFLSREIAPRRILSKAKLRLSTGSEEPPFEAPALVGVTWTNPLR